MESKKPEFTGPPCGKHGTQTFYKSFEFTIDGKENNLAIGEFFFMKISKEIPVCIGEIQLLWEDSNSNYQLSSLRLYFLPENTPEGRDEYHGEDEILALHHKMILKLADLIPMIQYDIDWTVGYPVPSDNTSNGDTIESERSQVVIRSYPQYCRFRTALKRLEGVKDKWLKNALVCALGGFSTKSKNCRVVYCLDTFYSSDLDELEIRCDHLAPSLKGRPRKKKLSLGKQSSHDSDSSNGQTDKNNYSDSPLLKPSPHKTRSQGCSFFEKNKTTEAEQCFLIALHKFMRNRNTPIERIPSLGFRQLDLYVFYKYAEKFGGYEAVTKKRLWKFLYDKLGGNPGSTSAATCTRRHYEKLLLPYEKYMKTIKGGHKEKKSVINKVIKDKIESKQEKEQIQAIIASQQLKLQTVNQVGVETKERQWNEIRKQNHKEKVKKAQRQTVKNLLDNVSAKTENSKQDWMNQSTNMVSQSLQVKSENPSVLEIPTIRQKTSILSPLAYRTAPKHLKPSATPSTSSPLTPTSSAFYANGYPLAASQLFSHSVIPSPRSMDKSRTPTPKNSSVVHPGGLTSPTLPTGHPHIPYMSTSVPAHSNHKRSYSVSDIMSPNFNSKPETPKRQRLEVPPSAHSVKPQETSAIDEPFDFSMKTLRKLDQRSSTHASKPLHSTQSGKITSKSHVSRSLQSHIANRSRSLSENFMSTKSSDRSVTPHDKSKPRVKEQVVTPSNVPVISSSNDIFNAAVHPAFQYAYLSQHSPTNLTSAATPLQLQQLYAAQFQANAAQLAAYEEMMRQQVGFFGQLNNGTPQILISPAQLYPQLMKDAQKFGATSK